MIHPAATPREYCHTGKRAQHGRRQIKALPQEAGFIASLRHNIWCDLRFEFVFITFRRQQASSGARPTRLSVAALAKFAMLGNGLGAKGASRQVTNHTKSFARRGFVKISGGTLTGRRLRQTRRAPYSFAAVASAGGGDAPGASATGVSLLTPRRPELRAPEELFDSTKSEMRGTISARKREPLNTP